MSAVIDDDEMVFEEESEFDDTMSDDDDDDFFEDENVASAPKTSKAKANAKAAPKKKAGQTKALSVNKNAGNLSAKGDTNEKSAVAKNGKKKTIEETYQKKSQLEHILLRPDTYIGSTEPVTQPMFVLDSEKGKIVEKEITFTPGLYKIFDEIVVNAADNKQRDPNMSELHITIDAENNQISVKNNGTGIPVKVHGEHKCYVPSLIFGELLTGSNFDDNEAKTTGGRNGYGAKLANIFSHVFIVECLDSTEGLKFTQTFRNNMGVKEAPLVKPCTSADKKKGDYTQITFQPDLKRFGMNSLDKDTVALLAKRAYDIAGSMASRHGKKLTVFLDKEKLPIKSFQDYLKMFEGIEAPVAYEKGGDRWEVGVAPSKEESSQQISFVNSICTSKGGGHVTYIIDQIAAHLTKTLKKKNKGGSEIKPAQIKSHLCVFVNCLVENPTFDSQTKENCTTRPKAFGSECKLSDKFLKQVDKSIIVENILQYANFKQNQALKRKGGSKKQKLTGITKLDDANFAGSAKSRDCTLIVTEGDSAKSLAMSGLSVIGRDYYGVFPLRGKPLNVRDAPIATITKNEEIKNMIDIIGLKFGVEYDESNIKTLRYGHLMIMADQDHDGSHIKGLVINFIHKFWPSLLDCDGFVKQFITPIVKATKGSKTKTFFTIPEVEKFRELPESKGYSYKYYKGLGTSTAEEAKEYFADLDTHVIPFNKLSLDNGDASDLGEDEDEDDKVIPDVTASGSDLIDMVFRKDRVEDRKNWLNSFEENTYLDYSRAQTKGVHYSEFVNREMILFSNADNKRSIACFVDGFKPSQRKILFACFKKNLKKEMKVAQLAGYIGEHAAFHHGEASLHGTITGMAQNFVGSNNVNLLTPSGQFGTRRMGGKDAASPRYIFTKLEPVTRTIFHPDDDELLNYLEDDGISIEPDFYVPVIPLVLVNGSEGIGTGWSSNVPNYCPREIIANLRLRIKGETAPKLHPKYYGYTGTINEKVGGSYTVEGKIERVDEKTLLISELPLKKWTQDYKVFLESLMVADPKKKQEVELQDFKENHTDSTVSFSITADPAKIDEFEKSKGGLYGKFKLTGTISTTNMTLFDTAGRISKFNSAESILSSFYDIRLEYYNKRKALLVEKLGREKRILENKARFVEEVCRGELVVNNRKRKELLAELKARGYETFPKDAKKSSNVENNEENEEEDENDSASDAELAKGYEYLLGMKIWSLTFEKAEKLRQELAAKTQELEDLEKKMPTEIWLDDLDAIEKALDERDVQMKENASREKKARNAAESKRRGKGPQKKAAPKRTSTKKPAPQKKKQEVWDSDMEDDDDDKGFSEDSDVELETMKPAAKKPVAAKSRVTAAAKKKPAAVTKAAARKPATAAAKKQAPPSPSSPTSPTESSGSNDDELDVDLAARLKSRLVVSPPAKSAGEKRKESPVKDLELLDSDDDEEEKEKSGKAAPAKKKAAPKRAKTAATKKAAPKKKSITLDDSDSEDDFGSGDSDAEVIQPPAPRERPGRAAAKKVVYQVDSDSDGEYDSDDE